LRTDKFWIVVLSAAAVISVTGAVLLDQVSAGKALIYSSGVLVESIDLAAVYEPFTVTIGDEGFNIIEVGPGRIRVLDADCKDRSCVRQGWISGGALPIVCLPNRLVIRLEDGSAPFVDAITG